MGRRRPASQVGHGGVVELCDPAAYVEPMPYEAATALPGPRRADPPLFIGSEIYRTSSYGPRHPLAIPRVSATIDLCRALGWLPDSSYCDSPRADVAALTRFHDPDYLAALLATEHSGRASPHDRERFNLGRLENPIFQQMFSRPATAAGASLYAADLLVAAALAGQGRVIYSPAGGTHHGRPDRASGFCYLNDPVLGILRMLDGGIERVCYVDYDAHHGDGVEDAFADDDRVLTLSIHERDRWPHTGAAAGWSHATACNLPVPMGFHDAELAYLLREAVVPVCTAFAPQIVVVQCGADALADDPLSKLSLSNGALWRAVTQSIELAPCALVLGGGGYNPWSVARCWTGVWAALCGHTIPAQLPAAGEDVLRGLTWHRAAGRNPPQHWFDTLADPPNSGAIRPEIHATAKAVLAKTNAWRPAI